MLMWGRSAPLQCDPALWSLRNTMKSYVVNMIDTHGVEVNVYLDHINAIVATNAALALMGRPASAWVSTEEYTNG